jgi:hypothetical protein
MTHPPVEDFEAAGTLARMKQVCIHVPAILLPNQARFPPELSQQKTA